jgi:hypothetical protein
MNMEYDDPIGSVYITGDYLYFDDTSTDTVGGSVLYAAYPIGG